MTAQAVSQRCVLARVNHHLALAHLRYSGIDPEVIRHVIIQTGQEPASQGSRAEQRHEAGAVDASPQPGHPVNVNLVPSTEGGRSYPLPERAGRERLTTPAALALADASLPHVHDLARGADAREFSEQPLEQGATAAAEARQIDDSWEFADDVTPAPLPEPVRPGGRVSERRSRWRPEKDIRT